MFTLVNQFVVVNTRRTWLTLFIRWWVTYDRSIYKTGYIFNSFNKNYISMFRRLSDIPHAILTYSDTFETIWPNAIWTVKVHECLMLV